MRSEADRQTVIAMKEAGHSVRQISRILKMSRKTIRRILAGEAADRIRRPGRYDPLAALVCSLFAKTKGNVVRIQQLLSDQHGHSVPYTSLTRMVRDLNLREPKVRRSGTFCYPPGKEAQHDTSPHRVCIEQKTVKAQCASMVLANSRLLFIQYYPRFTRFEAKIFLAEALEYFNGVTEVCIIDNTSVMVAAGSGAAAIIAPEMEAFARIYQMRFVAHAIGHANRSALVERNFHYVENNFLPGRQFDSWQQLNEAAKNWCDNTANNTIKRALGMTARQAYQSEKPFLKPLPAVKPPVYQALRRIVDLSGFIAVDSNRYSVPERLCGKNVEVHKTQNEIVVFYNHRPVATHCRLIDRRDAKSILAGHHLPPVRKTSNQPPPVRGKLAGHSPQLDDYVAKIRARSRQGATRNLQRLLALKRNYPRQAFDQAICRALHYGLFDLNRLENIILSCIAGDFFSIDDHDIEHE